MIPQISTTSLAKDELSDFLMKSNYEVEDSKEDEKGFYIVINGSNEEYMTPRPDNTLGDYVFQNSEADIGDETVAEEFEKAFNYKDNGKVVDEENLSCTYLKSLELDKMTIFNPDENEDEEEMNEGSILEGTIDSYLLRKGYYNRCQEGKTVFVIGGQSYLLDVEEVTNKKEVKYHVHGERLTE